MSAITVRHRPPVIFLHNPKAGGTTFRAILSRQYNARAVYTVGGRRHTTEDLKRIRSLDADKVRVIQGHIPFGVHELLRRDSTYVTLLRRPVERVISLYQFILTGRLRRMRDEGPLDLSSLAAFVERSALREVDNGQTRRLSGLDPEFGRCPDGMLERAKENLRERFSVVGLTERFDESVVLARRLFGWKSVLYLKTQVTRSGPREEVLGSVARRAVERYNELDLELYRYAEGLLEEAIGRQGPAFRAELDAFRSLNDECARRAAIGHRPAADGGAIADAAAVREAMLLDAHAHLLRYELELHKENDRLRSLYREPEDEQWLRAAESRGPRTRRQRIRRTALSLWKKLAPARARTERPEPTRPDG
jgi:Galactose-3-O-sulfotransferase